MTHPPPWQLPEHQPEAELHYIAASDLPEEQTDSRLIPFTGAAVPVATALSLDGRSHSPAIAALFPVAVTAHDWRAFSEWQRAEYGQAVKTEGSVRDSALSGKTVRKGNPSGARYGAASSTPAVAGTPGVYVAPLRLNPRTFSTYSRAMVTPVPADAPVTVTNPAADAAAAAGVRL